MNQERRKSVGRMGFIKKLSTVQLICSGFALLIFIGSVLLILPISVKSGVNLSYSDSLYISASAVCVTGLVSVPVASTFTLFGQVVIALLIQIGGLGVAFVGVGIIYAIGKKIDFKGRNLIREAMNLDSGKGIIGFIKNILFITLICESAGTLLSLIVFIRDYSFFKALFVSFFHTVASFNNAGFDIIGSNSLLPYSGGSFFSVFLKLTTSALVIIGGIGFLVIQDIFKSKFRFKKFSMHTKVVLSVSAVLIVLGTLSFYFTEDINFWDALFMSVSARTAGFSSVDLGAFSSAGIIVMCALMFVGASSGSTGGGIKTSTLYVLFQSIKKSATEKEGRAFRYSIPNEAYLKANVITILGIGVVFTGTFLISVFEPSTIGFRDVFFEVVSAFGTAGLSTGITQSLSLPSKIVSIIIMYIGRLGPLTIASFWNFGKEERIRYPEGNISIG